MHHQVDAPPQSLTSAALFTSLHGIGQRLRRNRRSVEKHVDAALADIGDVLLAVKQQAMDSLSAHSRVAEAQALMAKAVIANHAGLRLDEATCYLQAASIWFAIEREKVELNFPTTDEALSRAVLCSAMACQVLLSVRNGAFGSAAASPSNNGARGVNSAGTGSTSTSSGSGGSSGFGRTSNPIPPKLQRHAHEAMHPHAFRCYLICADVARQLHDFNCFEMSADYWALAAMVVSEEVPLRDVERRRRLLRPDGHEQQGHRCASSSSSATASHNIGAKAGGGASSVETAATSTMAQGDGSSPARSAFSISSFASRVRNSSFALGSSTARPSTATSAADAHADQAAAATTSQKPSQQASECGGASTAGTRCGGQAESSNGVAAGGVAIVVSPGCLFAYVAAVLSEAKIACFVKDNDRALLCLAEVIVQIEAQQSDLAPVEVREEARKLRAAAARAAVQTEQHPVDDEDAGAADEDEVEEDQCAAPTTNDSGLAPPLASNNSIVFSGGSMQASLAGPAAAPATSSTCSGRTAETGASSTPTGQRNTTTAASRAASSTSGAAAGTPAVPNPALFRAPRAEDASNAFYGALVALEAELIQARVLRFFVLLLARAPATQVLVDVDELALLAQLYRQQERRTRIEAHASTAAAQRQATAAIDAAVRKGQMTHVLRKAARPVSAVSYNEQNREEVARRAAAFGDVAAIARAELVCRPTLTRTFPSGAAPNVGAFLATLQQQRRQQQQPHTSNQLQQPRGAGPLHFTETPFSAQLRLLAETLRLMHSSFNAYATSRTPNLHVEHFRALQRDLAGLCAELGVRCREVIMLAQRALEAIVANPVAAIAPSVAELQAKRAARETAKI